MMTASAAAELTELTWALRSHTGMVRDENEDCLGVYAPREDDLDDATKCNVFNLF